MRVQRYGLLEVLNALPESLLGTLVPEISAFQIELPRIGILGEVAGEALPFLHAKAETKIVGDILRNFLLHRE